MGYHAFPFNTQSNGFVIASFAQIRALCLGFRHSTNKFCVSVEESRTTTASLPNYTDPMQFTYLDCIFVCFDNHHTSTRIIRTVVLIIEMWLIATCRNERIR